MDMSESFSPFGFLFCSLLCVLCALGGEFSGRGAPLQVAADRLSELYPDEASMRRVLALAGIDARRVAMGGQALNAWWSAVIEAQRQGRLAALVEVGLEEYPLDEWLWAAHQRLTRPGPQGNDNGE